MAQLLLLPLRSEVFTEWWSRGQIKLQVYSPCISASCRPQCEDLLAFPPSQKNDMRYGRCCMSPHQPSPLPVLTAALGATCRNTCAEISQTLVAPQSSPSAVLLGPRSRVSIVPALWVEPAPVRPDHHYAASASQRAIRQESCCCQAQDCAGCSLQV